MSHNRSKVNNVAPDASGNISINTDDVPETGSNEYYTPARVDAKIATTSINAFSDVSTAGASAGQVLVLGGGTWAPGSASPGATPDLRMIGDGTSTAYPWTGAAGTANEPYAVGKQIEFHGLSVGSGLSNIKYNVRSAGTTDGTSAWADVDAASYTTAGWVRRVMYLPVGVYFIQISVGISMPATSSYLVYQLFFNGSAHSSWSRVGDADGYPTELASVVEVTSAPVAATDNAIDVRVHQTSADLTAQGNVQAELGRLSVMKIS